MEQESDYTPKSYSLSKDKNSIFFEMKYFKASNWLSEAVWIFKLASTKKVKTKGWNYELFKIESPKVKMLRTFLNKCMQLKYITKFQVQSFGLRYYYKTTPEGKELYCNVNEPHADLYQHVMLPDGEPSNNQANWTRLYQVLAGKKFVKNKVLYFDYKAKLFRHQISTLQKSNANNSKGSTNNKRKNANDGLTEKPSKKDRGMSDAEFNAKQGMIIHKTSDQNFQTFSFIQNFSSSS